MKRILSMCLSVAVVLGALSSCGTPASSSSSGSGAGETSQSAQGGSQQQSYDLVWASTSSSSGYYALNVAMANVINENVDGVNITVMETGGTADNFKYMRDGQAHFGQTTDSDTFLLLNDMGTYEGYDYTGARMLCSCFPITYYMTVSEKSGIENIAGLEGKSFSAGLSGSSTEMDIMFALDACGITPNWYPASTSDAVDAMKNRQIDGFCKSGSVTSGDSSILDVMTSIDVKVLSWSEEEQKAVTEAHPYMSFATVSCEPLGLDYDVTSLSKYFGFCIDENVPNEVAYAIIKAIDENQDYIRDTYAGLGDYDIIEMTATYGTALLHPGVVQYLQEKGYELDEARIPS